MGKVGLSKSLVEETIIVFNIRVEMIIQWIPEAQTVNQNYYMKVLTKLRK
jgi:hypothetical protein